MIKIHNRKLESVFLLLFFSSISLITIVILLIDFNKPSYYNFLFLLPATFILVSWICFDVYKVIPQNIGISIVVVLFFIRNVISPLIMTFGDYSSTIQENIEQNSIDAIILVAYETVCVFVLMSYCVHNALILENNNERIYVLDDISKRKYVFLVLFIIFGIVLCYSISPQLMLNYRSITQIGDEHFTNYEDTYITEKYGVTFTSKFALVVGNYLMRAALIIVPATLMILMYEKNKYSKFSKICSYLFCCIPFFFIGGAIARSLIYFFCLLILRCFLYDKKSISKCIVVASIISLVIMILWWFYRLSLNSSVNFKSFSDRFSSYFSGVNIVSGVFNLPRNLDLRIKFFTYDYLTTLPFGNTIFGTGDDITIQPFFNQYNYSYGQIPTTIGMGYYYFGYILSPLYSLLFTSLAFSYGEKIRTRSFHGPFQFIRLMYGVFVYSMGIVMYNVEITMINTFCIIIPMIIMEKIAYDKK